MNNNKKEQKRRRMAAIIAIVLVIAMVLSLIAPIFSARAMATQMTTKLVTEQNKNGLQLSESYKKENEIGTDIFSVNTFIGFEQQYIVGNTVPVSAIMVNNGEDFKGEFQIKVDYTVYNQNEGKEYGIYYQPLELQKGAGKQINFSIPVGTIQKDFEVTLVDKKGKVVYKKYFSAKPLDPATILVGVLSERPTDMSYISAIHFAENEDYTGDYTKTVFLGKETFPSEKASMNHFKVIVIDDFDTKELSQQQKDALLEWIEYGGVCVIGTGVNASKTLGGLQNIVSVSNYDTISKSIVIEGERARADVAQLELSQIDGVETITDNASIIKIGTGSVILYDISLSLAPVTNIAGFVNNIKQCCEYASESLQLIEYTDSYENNPMQYVARRFPELKTSSIYIILATVAIYVVVIGPIVYIILKRKDKREMGWVVIPALSAIFMIAIFVLSINSQYKNGILNIVSATEIKQGQSTAKTDIYGYVKSRKKGDITLTSDEFANLSVPMKNAYRYNDITEEKCINKVLLSGKTEITYLNRRSWQSNNFEMETLTDLGGTIDCDMKMENDRLVGNIANHTNRNLKDIIVIAGKKVSVIDHLKSGESIDFNEEMIDKQNTNVSIRMWEIFNNLSDRATLNKRIKAGEITRQDAYRIMRENDLVQEYINWNESERKLLNEGNIKVYLYAFDEQGILPQTFYVNQNEPIENTLNLYMIDYDVTLSNAQSFEIPFGILSGNVIDNENEVYIREYGDGSLYSELSSEIVWGFTLPANTNIKSMQFRSLNDTGNFYAAPEIYNVKTDTWEALKSDTYYDIDNYINTDKYINISENMDSSEQQNNYVMVKYFVQKQTEVRYPEIRLEGAGQYAGN